MSPRCFSVAFKLPALPVPSVGLKPHCHSSSIRCWTLFVGAAPDIFYLKDTTGDGKADQQKVVFTGFSRKNVQGLLNSFRWTLDNRIHCATSTSGHAFKMAGRVGDSPILGAGLYVDNKVGTCGSIGHGEANLENCSSFRGV
ncbi:MAG: isoaspartyl peptidase/L-asparaginase, partial [Proteobacteria bacterium]|nr:isoaspartyl peptidase/L-asparaginase [Pseudomonadota bacterium]